MYNLSIHLGHEDILTTANIYGHLYLNSESKVSALLDNE